MKQNHTIPIILCGGSGSRLWPLSRRSYPKQFIKFDDKDEKTLLQNTISRIVGIKNIENPIIICNEEHRFIVAEQMRKINVKPSAILLEPFGRNTAPAVTLGSLLATKKFQNPNILVLSADHLIKDKSKFVKTINSSLELCEKERLVTFGISPNSPHTGYGYIKAKNEIQDSEIIGEQIENFIEKPNLETAKKLFNDRHYLWNSGIFLFKAKTILEEIERFEPQLLNICKKSIKNLQSDLDFQRIQKNIFRDCPNISIDVAIMEKTKLGTVVPLSAGWDDIGNWKSVWENSLKDNQDNAIQGNVILKDSKNCLFRTDKKLLVGIGLKNLVAINTNDAILIADNSKSQEVKQIVEMLKEKKYAEAENHRKTYRPWGFYISIVEDTGWQVKLISVKPGEKLSLQMHHHRSEHWIVVKGTAKVELNGTLECISENQSTYIPLGAKHRLSNPGKIPLVLIEVQSGSYVGEDDIVRFEDDYGRSNIKN